TSPTWISPFLNDTTEGVVRFPSGLAMIFASFPSNTATAELVVPKSIPIILLIINVSFFN
ncbi:unknown, partial [Enterococcus faecium DO]